MLPCGVQLFCFHHPTPAARFSIKFAAQALLCISIHPAVHWGTKHRFEDKIRIQDLIFPSVGSLVDPEIYSPCLVGCPLLAVVDDSLGTKHRFEDKIRIQDLIFPSVGSLVDPEIY